jgi:hypothetical protein
MSNGVKYLFANQLLLVTDVIKHARTQGLPRRISLFAISCQLAFNTVQKANLHLPHTRIAVSVLWLDYMVTCWSAGMFVLGSLMC